MAALPQHLSPSDWPASPLTSPDWLAGSPDSCGEDLRVQTQRQGQMVRMKTEYRLHRISTVYTVCVCVAVYVFCHERVCVDSGLHLQLSSSVAPQREQPRNKAKE